MNPADRLLGGARPARQQALALFAALLPPFGAAALGGLATSRSLKTWYAQVNKPTWSPPGTVIGSIWSVLYALMALSSWLVWREAARDPGRVALRWYAAQLGLNAAWSWVFFGARSIGGGLLVLASLWLAILGWIRAAARVSPLAALLQAPYLAWVTFAGLLNVTIWRMNRPDRS